MRRSEPKGWIGVDLGDRTVKVVQIGKRQGRAECLAAALVARSDRLPGPGNASPASLSDAQPLGVANDLCRPLRGRQAAAMMSMAKYELYLLEGRPSGRSRVDLAGWRALAVASALPLDLLSLDAWAAGAGRPKEALRTHVTGVRCADADRTVDSLEKLGWQCQVVDVPPWAAARALTLCPAYESERAAACLDWGYAAVTLSLVLGGRPIYARRLKAGGVGDVVAALAAQLDLPLMTAEQLLMRCPADAEVADRSWRAIRKIVADATTHVGREIIRTLDFWRSASSEVEVESLFLIGGGALLPGVAVQVGRACRRPVAMWDMPVSAHAEQPLPPPSLWASAAGLSALAWEEL